MSNPMLDTKIANVNASIEITAQAANLESPTSAPMTPLTNANSIDAIKVNPKANTSDGSFKTSSRHRMLKVNISSKGKLMMKPPVIQYR